MFLTCKVFIAAFFPKVSQINVLANQVGSRKLGADLLVVVRRFAVKCVGGGGLRIRRKLAASREVSSEPDCPAAHGAFLV